ncbi:MAG: hypothetical protein WC346_02830 [Methanogenium sp.]|jgi:hypothetical protein
MIRLKQLTDYMKQASLGLSNSEMYALEVYIDMENIYNMSKQQIIDKLYTLRRVNMPKTQLAQEDRQSLAAQVIEMIYGRKAFGSSGLYAQGKVIFNMLKKFEARKIDPISMHGIESELIPGRPIVNIGGTKFTVVKQIPIDNVGGLYAAYHKILSTQRIAPQSVRILRSNKQYWICVKGLWFEKF